MSLLRKILRRGQVAEPAPPAPRASESSQESARLYAGSVQIRHVDAGSCNGCELEMTSAFGPVHDAGRYGLGLVEGWRGTIAHRVEIRPDGTLARLKIVDPSFFNWPAVPVAMKDTIVPDFPLVNKSFNLSYAGNDL